MSAVINALIAACGSKACAPPPVGTGGSVPGAGGAPPAKPEELSSAEWSQIKSAPGSADRNSAVSVYTQAGFLAINGHLRGAPFDPRKIRIAHLMSSAVGVDDVRKKYDAEVAMIPHIDAAFRNGSHALSRDTLLFRGASFPSVDHLVPGAVLKDDGFMSTTTSRDTAVGFTDGKGMPVTYSITVPKGTRVLAGDMSENEVVLNRGTSLRVTRVRTSNDGYTMVEAEVVT